MCDEIHRRGIESAPDFITVDSADGGSGAAPMSLIDYMGLPIKESLPLVVDIAETTGLAGPHQGHRQRQDDHPGRKSPGRSASAPTSWFPRGASCSRSAASRRCNATRTPVPPASPHTTPNCSAASIPSTRRNRVKRYALAIRKEVGVIAHSCGVPEPRLVETLSLPHRAGQRKIGAPRRVVPGPAADASPGGIGNATVRYRSDGTLRRHAHRVLGTGISPTSRCPTKCSVASSTTPGSRRVAATGRAGTSSSSRTGPRGPALGPLIEPTYKRYLAEANAGANPWNTIAPADIDQADVDAVTIPPGFIDRLIHAPLVLLVTVDLSVVASMDQHLSRVGVISGASIYPFVWNHPARRAQRGPWRHADDLPGCRGSQGQGALRHSRQPCRGRHAADWQNGQATDALETQSRVRRSR